MQVHVNGEERSVPEGATLAELISGLGVDTGPIVIQRNDEIIERSRIGEVPLSDGDRIELVRFVGGG
jgi:thiamine biosynthesis protein ThiS